MEQSVSQHYAQELDTQQIIERLTAAYPQGPNPFQLAPVDQLHIGGIKASKKLLERIMSTGAKQILDIGSGLGGLMRLAEADQTLSIIGLDITHSLNTLNQQLSALSAKTQQPHLVTADAHHLPFRDAQFDLIVFQHSLLNMPDDQHVLAECFRILKPHGQLLLHEVIRGDNFSLMRYPVPWARSASNSHLVDADKLNALLTEAGFNVTLFSNWSDEALAWRKRQGEKEATKTPQEAPVSPAMILGPEFKIMGKNVMLNLANQAAAVVEVVAQKAEPSL